MNAVLSGRVPAGWACNACSPPAFHSCRSENAELEAEGQRLAEACDHVLDFLIRAIEFACRLPNRPPLRLAIVEGGPFDPRRVSRA